MSLFDDLRHSGRALRRSPAFTLAASLTLVLGMGAALVVLRLIDATLLRPLPGVAEPERLVAMTSSSVSYPSFLDFREAGDPVAEIAGFQNRPLVVGLPEGSERVQGAVVSGGFFCYPAIADDPWLDSVRKKPVFGKLVNHARKKHEDATAAFAKLGGDKVLGVAARAH